VKHRTRPPIPISEYSHAYGIATCQLTLGGWRYVRNGPFSGIWLVGVAVSESFDSIPRRGEVCVGAIQPSGDQ